MSAGLNGTRLERSGGATRGASGVDAPGRRRDAADRARTPDARPISARLAFDLPSDVLNQIAERAARLIAQGKAGAPEPWIGVDQAAEHLACPKSRVYRLVSRRAIPFEKDGARLLFKRSVLDAWVSAGGAEA
jgi:excisionase family DNA binding protein